MYCCGVQLFRGMCGVRFYDMQPERNPGPPGEFEQQVTIEDFYHERIDVPNIGDTRRATVLHDFNRVGTAVSLSWLCNNNDNNNNKN